MGAPRSPRRRKKLTLSFEALELVLIKLTNGWLHAYSTVMLGNPMLGLPFIKAMRWDLWIYSTLGTNGLDVCANEFTLGLAYPSITKLNIPMVCSSLSRPRSWLSLSAASHEPFDPIVPPHYESPVDRHFLSI